jgi:AbrB family looped-hinge helix DNA binding protein
MPIATLTSKGRITLPQAVRCALGLEAGDKVDFVPDPGGGYRVLALRRDVRVLRGMFAGRVARPVTPRAMDAAIEAEVASRSRATVMRAAEPAPRKRSR